MHNRTATTSPLLRNTSEVDEVIGIDFGAPQRARNQRRKIIAIAAQATGRCSYRVDVTGLNARLLESNSPGWTAKDLLTELLAHPARVVAFDFPFCIPLSLLEDVNFATTAGYQNGAFTGWHSFSRFVAERLPLTDPLDFRPFDVWRDRALRAQLWTKRSTDIAAGGQAPLKDKFQATFQMTLLGNALLSNLWESQKYRVLPFPGGSGEGEVLEVYPRATLRQMGLAIYKSRPDEAVRLSINACAAAGIKLDINQRLVELCYRYSSGGRTPDHDVADAFVGLCTAILHAEGACRPAIPEGTPQSQKEREGAIWVPTRPMVDRKAG